MIYTGCNKKIDGKTIRQVANMAIKALSKLCGSDCGKVSDPSELASVILSSGKNVMEAILGGDEIFYADGWFVIELDDFHFYCDLTPLAVSEIEANGESYKFIDDFID